jgi:hypothetical protein
MIGTVHTTMHPRTLIHRYWLVTDASGVVVQGDVDRAVNMAICTGSVGSTFSTTDRWGERRVTVNELIERKAR